MIGALLILAAIPWLPPEPTKTMNCEVRDGGALPDKECSPGAVDDVTLATLCSQPSRERRAVTPAMRRHVYEMYGLAPNPPPGAYEIDHVIPVCLLGASTYANLWPEPASSYHDKDRVEATICRRVCAGTLPLVEAQRIMATDWTNAVSR